MTQQNCIFCQIIAGDLKSTIVWQDDKILAINDMSPQAPCHLLIIPKQHYTDITECKDSFLLGNMLNQASQLMRKEGISSGFRVVINTGSHGGQTVPHIHIHVLGGRPMVWPPG
jgi:histidine triad (HIT) family protein